MEKLVIQSGTTFVSNFMKIESLDGQTGTIRHARCRFVEDSRQTLLDHLIITGVFCNLYTIDKPRKADITKKVSDG